MTPRELRSAVAAALETIPQVAAGEWTVHPGPVDAVQPPAYMVDWGPDPAGTVDTVCTDTAQVEVIVVAGRVEPEADYDTLDDALDAARTALFAARLRPYQWLAPTPLEMGQLTYLTQRLQLRHPVAIGGT